MHANHLDFTNYIRKYAQCLFKAYQRLTALLLFWFYLAIKQCNSSVQYNLLVLILPFSLCSSKFALTFKKYSCSRDQKNKKNKFHMFSDRSYPLCRLIYLTAS